MMTMKPTTTPGNASGNVSIASSSGLPGKRLRCKNKPTKDEIASVATVTTPNRRSIGSSQNAANSVMPGTANNQTLLPGRLRLDLLVTCTDIVISLQPGNVR